MTIEKYDNSDTGGEVVGRLSYDRDRELVRMRIMLQLGPDLSLALKYFTEVNRRGLEDEVSQAIEHILNAIQSGKDLRELLFKIENGEVDSETSLLIFNDLLSREDGARWLLQVLEVREADYHSVSLKFKDDIVKDSDLNLLRSIALQAHSVNGKSGDEILRSLEELVRNTRALKKSPRGEQSLELILDATLDENDAQRLQQAIFFLAKFLGEFLSYLFRR